MNMIERFEVAHRHFKVLSALAVRFDSKFVWITYAQSTDQFSIAVAVVQGEDESEHAFIERLNLAQRLVFGAESPYFIRGTARALYGRRNQFTVNWEEPRCEHCKSKPLAYEGAKFCGAGCTARHEGKMP